MEDAGAETMRTEELFVRRRAVLVALKATLFGAWDGKEILEDQRTQAVRYFCRYHCADWNYDRGSGEGIAQVLCCERGTYLRRDCWRVRTEQFKASEQTS